MNSLQKLFVINNISLPVHASYKEAFSVAKAKFKKAGITASTDNMFIYRRSIDARKKNDIRFVYSVAISSEFALDLSKLSKYGVSVYVPSSPEIAYGEKKCTAPIVVVGSGPAGMFSALFLSEHGYKVHLIERGGPIEDRKRIVDSFKESRVLDINTNIQFGAGGAGTFSDGKLVTRINDGLSTYILQRLVEFGAPEEILYLAKPHVGTDILSNVVDRILSRIEALGSKVSYYTEYLDHVENCGRVYKVITNKGDIECSYLILAIGHSARDTQHTLIKKGLNIDPKDFSVGMRIEHPRSLIDKGLYGDLAGDPVLPSGEYNLSYNTKVRGVYTFCMCPGGVVVPATSEENGVVVNGMSYHKRDGRNSNSAICSTIFKEDYGNRPELAIEFQREIERKAFVVGGANYNAPFITVGDFLQDRCENYCNDVIPTYFDGEGLTLARPESFLPRFVTENIKSALIDFNKKIPGFASSSAVLTGPETRTSSPIRIVRNNDTRCAIGYENLYPVGEGAGYAGGITSAAIDGLKTAIKIISISRP